MTHRAAARRRREGVFTGTASLIRLNLRLDRVRLPIWLILLIGLSWFSAAAVQEFYRTPEQIALYGNTVGASAATIAMNGPALGLDTIGGITVFEIGTSLFIGTALMAIFLTTRHTRAEEESGRTELVLAGVVNRKSPILAAAVVVGCACFVVGAGVAAGLISAGLETASSLVFGAAVATSGLAFAAITLLAAQVTEHSRGATGLALAALAVAFLLRAVGDVTESWISWLSPIGWSQQSGAFGPDRLWPLLVSAAFIVVCLALARRLAQRRDFGAGLVRPKPGPADASSRLRGTFALSLRLQRGAIIGWSFAALVLGVAYGSLGREVEQLVEGNEQMEKFFASQGSSITESYFATVVVVGALILSGFVVSSVLRLNSEESNLRVEPLLAASVPRVRWAVTSLAVTLIGTVVLLLLYGLGMGVAESIVTGDSSWIGRLVVDALKFVPAALLLGAVTFLVFGWLPRASMAGWAALALCVVIGWLGPLLELPTWLSNLSPFQHPDGGLIVAGVTAVLIVVGLAGLRRRDLATG